MTTATYDEKVEAIHQIMHPDSGSWVECDKFWCMDFIPAFVDGEVVLTDRAHKGNCLGVKVVDRIMEEEE